VIDYKLSQAKKDYKDLLSLNDHYAESEVISILKLIQNTINVRNDKKLIEKIQKYIDWTRNNKDGDAIIIDYGNWLEKSVLNIK
jgi:hypothetical protein